MDSLPLLFLFFSILTFSSSSSSSSVKIVNGAGTIAFNTLGRTRYNFDIFTTSITSTSVEYNSQLQLTDGVSVNYNGFFLPSSTSLLYVSERNGVCNIYLDANPLLQPEDHPPYSMKDRPSISGDRLIYVSTREPSPSPRQSSTAVYSTHLPTNLTTRLTPYGVADYSPSVSPSGTWTAVASSGDRPWSGESQELNTSIHVFKTLDGSSRTLLLDHAGWPCWSDDSTLYFHRRSSDGWWSVYRATIGFDDDADNPFVVLLHRVTAPGFHAFTPAAAAAGNPAIIAVATRRPGSAYRHIELLDVARNVFVPVTKPISPNAHHYNPFVSADGKRIGYHRCRGGRNGNGNGKRSLLLENIESPSPDTFSLFRIDGLFPSFSHDGKHIAYAGFPGLYVVNSDGSGEPRKVFGGNAFSTAWDWKRKGVIYTSHGPIFATESTKVDIISITLGDDNSEPSIKKLTNGGENNAFPCSSPDGKWVAFRSGRSGHKNLYIMDAVEGDDGGVKRLTEGPWSDTMCNWSPDGEGIAFASDRDSPGTGSFAIYIVHPNGTGLRKVFDSGEGGTSNHPWFSPDSKTLVFTSDYGGVSAEPISNPHNFQPYGSIFTVNIDGSDFRQLAYNSHEDGTPTWTPFFIKPSDVAKSTQSDAQCKFDDCYWLAIEADANIALVGDDGDDCWIK